ncbi:MAG: response regulator [Lachnospiraceae bacterium]|nr:response regulator [Lachnospiraceae bacterium]
MQGFKFLFILFALAVMACAIIEFRHKRRNYGFTAVCLIVSICDLLCTGLISAQSVRDARYILLPYYILHAWLLFAFFIMIIRIEGVKRFKPLIGVSALICVYQTYLAVSQYFGARIFSFQKRIYFGKAWWVATDSKYTGLLFSYRSYRIMIYINITIGIIILASCIKDTHKIFKLRYIVFILMLLAYSLIEGMTISFSLPIWISCIIHTFIPVVSLYFIRYFAKSTLREWSLDNFANDMSDGLILYDANDDLIHINDMIKNTLQESMFEEFKDRSKLDEWLSNTTVVENIEVVEYENDNKKYYFKVSVRELGEKKAGIGTLYILHDNTGSITRLQAMQEANSELERAAKMKSDFLANMSHEIRTPMNAVIGMAEIAMREEKSPEVMDYLRQIQSSGRNLLNIINDILDYSKIESGKMEIIRENYELFEELSDISNILATRVGDKDLELFVLVDSDIPKLLYGDVMRIRQVLINLANNAIKFTPEGFVWVRVSCEKTGSDTVELTYHVIDTGIGIKKEDLGKLFQSFQQVDSRRNRSVEGTGLGLAISQRLVEAMDGQIGVNSEYGKGSDFWFKVPQKIVDPTNVIAVEDADNKYATVVNSNIDMVGAFVREMSQLGVEARAIRSLEEFTPSDKKDYVFFEEEMYTDDTKKFLDENPDIIGIMLVRFASKTDSDRDNLRIMRRPETTMNMVNILNDRTSEVVEDVDNKAFVIDYTAPDARILVVDDNDINLTIAEGLLAPLNTHIDLARSGQEAVDKVRNDIYDVVLMDHMMPGMDGVDATKTIRTMGRMIVQPVIIAATANVMSDAKVLFKDAGMDDFVAKPIDVKDIVTKLKRWLPQEKIIQTEGISTVQVSGDSAGRSTIVDCEGIDTAKAIAALGTVDLYEKITGEYYKSGEEKLSGIMNAYDTEDWADYTIRVHALKSSSRQIGAMQLGDMAEELEKAGKTGDIDKIRSGNDEAMTEFRRILDALKGTFDDMLKEDESSDKPLIESETLIKAMDELEEACDMLDMDAMENVENKLKKYSYEAGMNDLIQTLIKAINEIDPDGCMEMIRKIRNSGRNSI